MTLRGGGGGGRGRGSGGATPSAPTQKLSREQWEALDAMVELMKKVKKKKEGSNAHRTFEKLMKQHHKKESGGSSSTSSSCSSEDEGDYFADLFSTKKTKKHKQKKQKKAKKENKAGKYENNELDKERERRHEAELQAARQQSELIAIKEGMAILKEKKGTIEHDDINDVMEKATPTRPEAPKPNKKAASTGFFAGCFDEATELPPERGLEVWHNIVSAMESCAGKGFPATITVTAEVEKRCKKIAEVLCDTHLLGIAPKVVTEFANEHGVRGSNTTKVNITKTILRAIIWKHKGKGLEFDVIGLDEELKPF